MKAASTTVSTAPRRDAGEAPASPPETNAQENDAGPKPGGWDSESGPEWDRAPFGGVSRPMAGARGGCLGPHLHADELQTPTKALGPTGNPGLLSKTILLGGGRLS